MCPIKPLEMESSRIGAATVLALSGHISTVESRAVSDALDRLVSEKAFPIVVDMSGVDIITSDGLGALIRARKAAAESSGTLVLSGLAGNILDVFRMTRLDKIFTLYDTPETAAAALSA